MIWMTSTDNRFPAAVSRIGTAESVCLDKIYIVRVFIAKLIRNAGKDIPAV
jgi:hypothetical protein